MFVLLILYYVVMILLDIQKEKAAKAAELEKNHEEEIDISDEASTFKPMMIIRDEPKKASSAESSAETTDKSDTEDKKQTGANNQEVVKPEKNQSDNKPAEHGSSPKRSDSFEPQHDETLKEDKDNTTTIKRDGYREAYMTDGIPVEQIIQQVDEYAETGKGPLGEIIFECRSAQF